jgi:hypothetical protein
MTTGNKLINEEALTMLYEKGDKKRAAFMGEKEAGEEPKRKRAKPTATDAREEAKKAKKKEQKDRIKKLEKENKEFRKKDRVRSAKEKITKKEKL